MAIRLARIQDCEELLGIYGQYIDTAITFEYELPGVHAFAERIGGILTLYPYLVWEEEGRILGYAYAHRHREREAYQWNVELSVYVDRAWVHHGIGGQLYRALLTLLAMQGVRTAYSFVRIPNERSEGLHEALGFTRVGEYHKAGYKLGAWHDIAIFEKSLAPHEDSPAELIPIWKLDHAATERVLAEHSQL